LSTGNRPSGISAAWPAAFSFVPECEPSAIGHPQLVGGAESAIGRNECFSRIATYPSDNKEFNPRSSFARKARILLKAKEIELQVRLSAVFSTPPFFRPGRNWPQGDNPVFRFH